MYQFASNLKKSQKIHEYGNLVIQYRKFHESLAVKLHTFITYDF